MLKKKRLIFAGNNFRRCEFPPENLSPQIFAYFFSAPCLDTTVVSKLTKLSREFFSRISRFFRAQIRKNKSLTKIRKFAKMRKFQTHENPKPQKSFLKNSKFYNNLQKKDQRHPLFQPITNEQFYSPPQMS